MRLKLRVSASMSSTTAEEEDLLNLKPASYETADELGEGSTRVYKVADGADEQSLNLAGLTTVNFLYLRTNKAITLHVTDAGGTNDFPIGVPEGFEYGHFLSTATGVTALAVSNDSGSTAKITAALAGDEE
jgi:hypothetical protein